MVYLFLGDDLSAKTARIAEIKNKLFKDFQEALSFDFDNLDAKELGADQLAKAFLTLPAVAPHRLIILRNVHKLKSPDVEVLLKFCQNPAKHCDVVLESQENILKGDLKDLALHAKGVVMARPEGPNVFDMTRLMNSQRGGDALKMLDGFWRADVRPLAIMGALVWFWGKEGKPLGKERFERGLKALEEADLNIKRSRLQPQYAVEKVVVELSQLLRR
jgi:DNA polymerase III delta subunit